MFNLYIFDIVAVLINIYLLRFANVTGRIEDFQGPQFTEILVFPVLTI